MTDGSLKKAKPFHAMNLDVTCQSLNSRAPQGAVKHPLGWLKAEVSCPCGWSCHCDAPGRVALNRPGQPTRHHFYQTFAQARGAIAVLTQEWMQHKEQ